MFLGGGFQILIGVLQRLLGDVFEFVAHHRIFGQLGLQILEGFGGRFVGELHEALEHCELLVERFLNAERLFLRAQGGAGFSGLESAFLKVFVMLGELGKIGGELLLRLGGLLKGLLLILGLGIGGGFLEGIGGVARGFVQHGDGVIGVARAFAAFFFGEVLLVGIATKCLLHLGDAFVEFLLLSQ